MSKSAGDLNAGLGRLLAGPLRAAIFGFRGTERCPRRAHHGELQELGVEPRDFPARDAAWSPSFMRTDVTVVSSSEVGSVISRNARQMERTWYEVGSRRTSGARSTTASWGPRPCGGRGDGVSLGRGRPDRDHAETDCEPGNMDDSDRRTASTLER